MGLLEGFVGKIQKHGYTGELSLELDPIRSEHPIAGLGRGFLSAPAGAAAGRQSFSLRVASGHAFHLKTLIINNHQEKGVIYFYDGPGVSAPMFNLILEQSTGEYFNKFTGLQFYSIPMISYAGSSVDGRIGGLIRERTAD